jgi:hypothetical protein
MICRFADGLQSKLSGAEIKEAKEALKVDRGFNGYSRIFDAE